MVVPAPDRDEVTQLRRSMNDLLSLMALPAMWTGADLPHVVGTLLDVLLGLLELDFVHVFLAQSDLDVADMVRFAPPLAATLRPEAIRRALIDTFGSDASLWPPAGAIGTGAGAVSIATVQLGLQGEIGTIVAGSRRPGFAGDTERLLLSVAANQAALALQEARLRDDQKRHAADLDRRVAQRTAELAQANAALQDALLKAEQVWGSVIDGIPGLTATVTPEGVMESANRQIMEYLGVGLEEMRNWGFNDIVHPEDRPRALELFARAMATGEPYESEQRVRRHDGVYRWFSSRGRPERDSSGRILRWCILLVDIDEKKHVEEALRESERQSRLIVDSIPGGIAIFAPDGQVEGANRQLLDYFGKPLEEVKHWATNGLTHPDELPNLTKAFAEMIASGQPGSFTARLRRHDGAYRWFEVRDLPLRDADGHILRWYGLLTDIDDRKRAEDAVAGKRARLAHDARYHSGRHHRGLARERHHRRQQPASRISRPQPGCPEAMDDHRHGAP